MNNFKVRVLDMAINEINEHTDIDIKYEQQKQGRKNVGFTFEFKQKKTNKNLLMIIANKILSLK